MRTVGRIRGAIARRLGAETGQTMIEYALIVSAISLAALSVLTPLHDAIVNTLNAVAAQL